MTVKRFTYINDRILENGTHFAYANSECNAEDITDKLNELATNCNQLKNENEQLKKELNEFKQLDIPIDKIEDTVRDGRGRTVGVYYNDWKTM